MIPRTFPSSVASNGSTQMIVYFLPSVSGMTRWVDYIPVKFTTVATAATENTYDQNGYIPVVSISSIAGATPFKEYVPVFLDSSAADAEVWKVNITGFIPVGTAGIGGAALYMDFAATTTLDPRVTFSRTTNATLTNSAGLVANAPMNLLTFSEQFDNAAWIKVTAPVVTANAIAAPDGAVTADLLAKTTTNFQAVRQSVTLVSAATVSESVHAKRGLSDYIAFTDDGSCVLTVDLRDGTITRNTAFSSVVVAPAGDGWFRISYSRARGAGATSALYMWPTDVANSASFTTASSSVSCYIWGAQLELGSTATTYNPTTVKNLLGFTENFDNAAWTKSNATISATKVDDIYGQPFAQKLVEDAANSTHQLLQTVTVVQGSTYTVSTYAKKAEVDVLTIDFAGALLGTYNLTTGVATLGPGSVTNIPLTNSIVSLGNDWYRCAATFTRDGATATSTVRFSLRQSTSYTGDGTSGIYIFGAQLSDSASVDPYVYNPVAAPSSVAYYGPRFDYDPVTLAPKGLLIEEQRTNLITYSEQFDNAAWTKSATTVTANAAVAPDGTTTADTLASDGTSTQHIVAAAPTLAATTAYAFSVYAKAGATNFLQITTNLTAGSSNHYANFNLQTGVVSAVGSSATATIAAVGNGWYRCTAVMTTVLTSSSATFILAPVDSGTATRNPTFATATSVQIWGAQLEAGSQATSYIPTVASQVTRAADSASMIGNNFARWYNQTEGTLFGESQKVSATVSAINPVAMLESLAIDRQGIQYTTASQIESFAVASSLPQANFLVSATITNPVKTAYAYKVNDFAASVNGADALTDTAGTIPDVSSLRIGNRTLISSQFLNGTIKRIAYYNRRLSNTELQGITS